MDYSRFIKIISRTTSSFSPEAEAAKHMGLGMMLSMKISWEDLKAQVTPDNSKFFKAFFVMSDQPWEEKDSPKPEPKHYSTHDWEADFDGTIRHYNPFTNVDYKGKNSITLENSKKAHHFTSNEWATYSAWNKAGKNVSGSYTLIEKWAPLRDRYGQERMRKLATYKLYNRDQTI